MKPAPLVLAVAIALNSASAAHASGRKPVDLPAGRLADAAIALGRQTGISIGIVDPVLAGRQVRAVKGRMEATDAIRHMLEGTGAQAVPIDATSWRIVRRAPAAIAPAARAVADPGLPTPPMEDLVVTASKRNTPLPAYPGNATVIIGSSFMPGGHAGGSDAIAAQAPTVSSTHIGPGRNKLFIRGIADSSFTGPTQATSGQYLGDTRLNYNAPDPDLRLYDIGSVEILEGPQGTLYGAGSLGGIIRIVRNPPQLETIESAVSAGAALTAHGAASADGSAMLNLPIMEESVGLRLVGYAASDGGYIDDLERGLDDINSTRTYGGRAALRLVPDAEWTIDLGTAWQRIEGDDSQYATRGGPPLTRRSAIAQDFTNDFLLGDISVAREWGLLRFTLTSGIVRHNLDETYDATQPVIAAGEAPVTDDPASAVPLPSGTARDGVLRAFRQNNRTLLWSNEARISRAMEDGFGWLVGASYIRNRARITRALGVIDRETPNTGVRNVATETTLFGEASIEPLTGLTLTAGGRIGHVRLAGEGLDIAAVEKLIVAQAASARRSETSFLPSFAVSVRPIGDLILYARYQEGFRPGGLAVRDDFIQRYRNDEVATMEFGVRHGAPGLTRFHASAAFAYTRWKNIQADIIDAQGLPATTNIGDGRIYSIDARIGWTPRADLRLDAAAFYNDSQVTRSVASLVSLDRGTLPNVAQFGGRAGIDWRGSLSDTVGLNLAASARYVGKSRLGVGTLLDMPQGNYFDTTAFARLGWDRYGLSLTMTNLLDSVGNRFALGSPFTLDREDQITPLRPRTVRLGFDMRF